MGLKDLLFGKKSIKTDDFFGEIASQRFKPNRRSSISWYINYQLPCFEEEASIILEGDKAGPYPLEREEIIHFLQNFETHYAKEIDNLILYNNDFKKLKYWRQDYYLTFITPNLDSPTLFEIGFDSYENQEEYFYFMLNNRKIEEFAISKNKD